MRMKKGSRSGVSPQLICLCPTRSVHPVNLAIEDSIAGPIEPKPVVLHAFAISTAAMKLCVSGPCRLQLLAPLGPFQPCLVACVASSRLADYPTLM
jgi:hypothetical protein